MPYRCGEKEGGEMIDGGGRERGDEASTSLAEEARRDGTRDER